MTGSLAIAWARPRIARQVARASSSSRTTDHEAAEASQAVVLTM